ncbi:MAG TPA: CapA family protein [Cyclobacteriaceae bacterium]|nr:CapA family protein [Cyclobacteriaceae bacterium]
MRNFLNIVLINVLIVIQLQAQDSLRMKLLFFGDIMQHDSQIQGAYDAKRGVYDYTSCFEPLRELFSTADLVIGNLELTLAGPPYKGYPQFSAPDALAVALKDVGVDVLVTANNHSLDRRKQGLERTIDVLDSLGFYYTGTFKNAEERAQKYPLIIEQNGFRLALLNYTYGTNGIPVTKPNVVNLIDTAQIARDLHKARTQTPDAIIVFMHWGNEYERAASKAQKDLAGFCFDKGATMVIGAHPHVLQPAAFHPDKNQLVAYSLGNFVSGQRVRYRDGGMLLEVDLLKVNDSIRKTSIADAGYHLVWVHREAAGNRAYKMIPVQCTEQYDDVLTDKSVHEQLKVFADDSRAWLGKYNVNIPELNWPAPVTKVLLESIVEQDTLTNQQYAVQFFTSSQKLVLDLLPEHLRPLMFTKLTTEGLTKYFIGKFSSKAEAEQYKQELIRLTDFKDAFVLEWKPFVED